MTEEESIQAMADELGIVVKENDFSFNKQLIASRINELIQNDFQKLISILYRMDISEEKLKNLLKEKQGIDAGHIITDLMIERQLQKIKSRRQSDSYRINRRDNDIDENEKW